MTTTAHDLINKSAPIDEIGAWFDSQSPEARREVATSLSSAQQAKLFELAGAEGALTLDDFARSTAAPLTAVPHYGQNTLPMPRGLQRFVKWMTRDSQGLVCGYNSSPFRYLIGPGYFVMRDCEGDELKRGPVVVDYYLRPTERCAEWPFLLPNWVGPQVLVYFQTRDYMRRVSQHVTIGAAYKWDRPLNSYFTLCREDPA